MILSTLTPPSNVPVGASKSTLAVIFVPECTYRIFDVVPLSPKFNPLPSSAALSVLPLATVIVDAETTNSAFEAAVCSPSTVKFPGIVTLFPSKVIPSTVTAPFVDVIAKSF